MNDARAAGLLDGMRIHHVQLSGPPGCEDLMRDFYSDTLGMTEIAKPESLRARGGVWFRAGSVEIHIGIEEDFRPSPKAHPGFAVADVDAVASRVAGSGGSVTWDGDIPGLRRFHTKDPVGNRLEYQQAAG